MYFNRNDHAANALKMFERTGCKLPAKVRAGMQRSDKIREFIGADLVGANQTLVSTILAAVAAGTDPTTDPDVQAATARAVWAMPAISSTLNAAAEQASAQVVIDGAGDLIEAMRSQFDAATKKLTEAHEVLGNIDLERDANTVLRRGGNVPAAWASASEANTQLEQIITTWRAVAQAAGVASEEMPAAYVEWDAAKWYATHHAQRAEIVGHNAWDAVCRGWTLRLASLAELAKLRAEVAEEQVRALEEAKANRYKRPSIAR